MTQDQPTRRSVGPRWVSSENNVGCVVTARAQEDPILQDDPCQAKSKLVGDVQYCDRYWECEFGQPELYDCPNGLVWIGRNQGIADGCDYPWRHTNICKDKDLASKYSVILVYYQKYRAHVENCPLANTANTAQLKPQGGKRSLL